MSRDDIIAAIRAVLAERMESRHLDRFGPDARLNEDLYLDSVLLLNLYLHLETEYAIVAPDEVVSSADIRTVGELAGLLAGEEATPQPAAPLGEGVHGEEYYDIKVHCVVSCLCAALKQAPVIDHRPFYFGVWDADFAVSDERALLYHAPSVSHDFFRHWFHRLYGVEVHQWYEPARSKAWNLERLRGLVAGRTPGEYLMVMVDLHHLPERENKFNQDPFPHYLMVEETGDPRIWRVNDPDFRWEGDVERDRILNAAAQPTVGGGFVFDRTAARSARPEDVADFFNACFRPSDNPLTRAAGEIVRAHLDGVDGLKPAGLAEALRELPVLSIRKYAYEHGFAFFWRALNLPDSEFQAWCDEIDALAQGLRGAHFAALKFARTGDRSEAERVFEILDRADRCEFGIKARLAFVFAEWRRAALGEPAELPFRGAAE